MKLRMTIVSPGIAEQARAEVDMLRRAVDAGDLDRADAATACLLELTAACRSIDLSEEDWREFVTEVRRGNPAFESSYLLPGEVCASLFPTITASEQVLELPIDGETGEDEIDV
jgi:hypothetical protein